jgi:hypothetical protein
MANLAQVPEWHSAAVLGAAIALLGFVGKSIVEARTQARNARLAQRAQLVELHSLLRASGVARDKYALRMGDPNADGRIDLIVGRVEAPSRPATMTPAAPPLPRSGFQFQ